MSEETDKVTKIKHTHNFELGPNLGLVLLVVVIVAGIILYKMVGGH